MQGNACAVNWLLPTLVVVQGTATPTSAPSLVKELLYGKEVHSTVQRRTMRLFYSTTSTPRYKNTYCNNGAITAHTKSNSYTSQLTVNIGAEVHSTEITCAYDSGHEIATIGSLNITAGKL